MDYGYKQQIINNLNEINNNSNNHYTYKDLSFLSKIKSQNKNLIIIFHGAIPVLDIGKHKVIFRGFNYDFDNTDIICVSDYLLEKYNDKYYVNWTLQTEKYPKSDDLYCEIFSYYINKKNYEKIIFTGTSAGGFPAIKFSSFFKQTALISNSQLYLENYPAPIISNLSNQLGDKLIYKEKLIEEIVLKSNPKKIIYYQNEKDNGNENVLDHFQEFLNFKKFLEDNNLINILEPHLFLKDHGCSRKNHTFQFPNELRLNDVLQLNLLKN